MITGIADSVLTARAASAADGPSWLMADQDFGGCRHADWANRPLNEAERIRATATGRSAPLEATPSPPARSAAGRRS